jgi:hypothetical protein
MITKNKEGQIVKTEEVQRVISSEQVKQEIESLTRMIDTFKSRISDLEVTLKQVLELEGKK